MPEKSKRGPAERAAAFAALTRKHSQPLPAITLTEGGQASFTIPKSRYWAGLRLLVQGTYKAIHATEVSFTPARGAPYGLVKNVKVDFNNGFTPVNLSGKDIYFTMLANRAAAAFAAATSGRVATLMTTTSAASAGAAASFRFFLDVPLTLNTRDHHGLINVQNGEIEARVTLECDTILAAILGSASGYSTSTPAITVTPIIDSFSIPPSVDAQPDLNIFKQLQVKSQGVVAGLNQVEFLTGQTYRKIFLDLVDSSGVGIADTIVTDGFQFVFNVADTPLYLKPLDLVAQNNLDYGLATGLPAGLYIVDFTTHSGVPNFSGYRDYIDGDKLTEFWLKFTASAAGTIRVITESITQLSV